MRLRITDKNFTIKFNWLFKLSDENGNIFYIMNESFYKNHSLKSPITKKELDYFDSGQWINSHIDLFDGKGVVVKIC